MPRFYDCCTAPGKEVLKGMALQLGMLDYHPEDPWQKAVTVKGNMESTEEIGRIMSKPPASHNELRGEL
jgi:hypothetical protein